ncbi:hypothetical protein T484DRAFT_1918324, partial [Baffinella frigidus]
ASPPPGLDGQRPTLDVTGQTSVDPSGPKSVPRVLKTHAPSPGPKVVEAAPEEPLAVEVAAAPEVDAGLEAPLPEGWVVQHHQGKKCYVNHTLQAFSWTLPKSPEPLHLEKQTS